MSWFPVDDALHSHPKAQKAGDKALGMWTRAGAYCMAYLTDGFIPDWWIKQQPRGAAKAKRLVEAELWRRGEKDGESGWWFHDWRPENTKTNVLAARENARQRKARSRESQQTSRVTDTVTGHVTDASCLGLTHANPTQSINPVVDSGGELSQVGPTCPRHPHGTQQPCGACADARRRYELTENRRTENEIATRRRAREVREACMFCDEQGWLLGSDPVVKCIHQQASNG